MKTIEILERVRLVAAEQNRRRDEIPVAKVPMYCEKCRRSTPHTMYCNGEWERYQCDCGEQKEYRVR